MIDFIQRIFRLGDYSSERCIGAARSPLWSGVRNAFIKANPFCAVCGTTKKLEAHHCLVFHLNPADELNPANLISLCRPHHYLYGHLDDWSSFNATVRDDAKTWEQKILSRPK